MNYELQTPASEIKCPQPLLPSISPGIGSSLQPQFPHLLKGLLILSWPPEQGGCETHKS